MGAPFPKLLSWSIRLGACLRRLQLSDDSGLWRPPYLRGLPVPIHHGADRGDDDPMRAQVKTSGLAVLLAVVASTALAGEAAASDPLPPYFRTGVLTSADR